MKLSVRPHAVLLPLKLAPLLPLLLTALPAHAASAKPAAATKPPVLKAGQNNLNWLFRYRAEYVDQDGLPEQALANTLLTRLSPSRVLAITGAPAWNLIMSRRSMTAGTTIV